MSRDVGGKRKRPKVESGVIRKGLSAGDSSVSFKWGFFTRPLFFACEYDYWKYYLYQSLIVRSMPAQARSYSASILSSVFDIWDIWPVDYVKSGSLDTTIRVRAYI